MVHAKFHNSGCIPECPFPRYGQNMALLLPKHGPHMVLPSGSSWILINVPRDVPCQISESKHQYWQIFSIVWLSHSVTHSVSDRKKMQCSVPGQRPKAGLKTAGLGGIGWRRYRFTLLGVSGSPLFLKKAKIRPFYGHNIVLTLSLKLVLLPFQLICSGMSHAKFHIAGCIL